ncbi:PaaI family thioesterase [Brachyspira pilosicoli]|uniref:PaaI family thioesterase n=1 Tax=Brachyspira pilosicoli TaxID=52584 RepID=A0A5C8FB83_BRAPL|nr:PaaI family thioesterase [Brachyspira pilosicoli]TXJ47023.1 PaaI family thioesterase [Brachyspira pilosicoli]
MQEKIYKRLSNIFYNQDFLNFIGCKLEEADEGKVVISLENRKEFTQTLGFMHGGMVASLLDTASGFAAFSVIDEKNHVVTSELKINYLLPVVCKKLKCVGKVLKAGRTIIVVEANLFDEENKILAKMLGTMVVVPNSYADEVKEV